MLTSANRTLERFAMAFFASILAIAACAITMPAYATSTDNGIPDGYKPDIYNSIPRLITANAP